MHKEELESNMIHLHKIQSIHAKRGENTQNTEQKRVCKTQRKHTKDARQEETHKNRIKIEFILGLGK